MKKISVLIIGCYVDSSFIDPSIFFPCFIQAEELKSNLSLDIDFIEPIKDYYDAVIVLNTPMTSLTVRVPHGNLFCLMQEPGVRFCHPFMFSKLLQYDVVFSPLQQSKNSILSSPYLAWHLYKTFSELRKMDVPQKNRAISCIASNLSFLHGHTVRVNFLHYLKSSPLKIDFYGKGTNYILDKSEGLFNYHYSIAMENSQKPYYFTEKINDCFLSYTIPFYFGCTNIERFFPAKSFIKIDINEPQRAIKTIRDTLENEDPKDRLPALREARELVLNEYNLNGFINRIKPTIVENILNNPKPHTRFLKSNPRRLIDKVLFFLFKRIGLAKHL